jgi:transposase-like protein
MTKSKSIYRHHPRPADSISCAVRGYFRFQLSLHDIEELLVEYGITVTRAAKEVPLGDETIRKHAAPENTWLLAHALHS